MNKLAKKSKRLFKNKKNGFTYLHNEKIVKKWIEDIEFPFFISFPRTGSHWIRTVMELYFEKPSLTRIFFYPKEKKFTCYHAHDIYDKYFIDNIQRMNILYLYRNPPETIFSQLNHENSSLDNKDMIIFWSKVYGLHLKKWLIEEKYSVHKTIIKYDNFKNNFVSEFRKITDFFNEKIDEDRLNGIIKNLTKESIKNRLGDQKKNHRIINTSNNYDRNKELFVNTHSDLIYDVIFDIDSNLKSYFYKLSK